jgi:transcriptional regulator with XRE-family HTH domain
MRQQDAIKALRKHMGLTQAQFAQELGVHRQKTVSEWENGAYDPDRSKMKFLELIAKHSKFQKIKKSVAPHRYATLGLIKGFTSFNHRKKSAA